MVSVIVPLWFSRLVLKGRVRDAHELHRTLWKAFDAEERPFLFRADTVRVDGAARVKVLVQSDEEAHWSALEGALVESQQVFREIDLRQGERLRFFLRGNPTVSRKGRDEPAFSGIEGDEFLARRGHRVALLREEERLAWLGRKAEACGFEVSGVRTSNSRPVRWSHEGNAARHDGIDFEGHLVVKYAENLAVALREGLGPAKAFGFGLLSLARDRG